MSAYESVKQKFEDVTGLGKPTPAEAKAALRKVEPRSFKFEPDGTVPNNPTLPFLVYKQAVALDGKFDPASVFEQLFSANAWGDSWRNGVYPYVHFHPSIHEVLGIARGSGRVRFGGASGVELDIEAGDVAVLPAGTGHQRIATSDDFLVVGAYPPDGSYEECRESDDYERARILIAQTPPPSQDPLYGPAGPLIRLWAS